MSNSRVKWPLFTRQRAHLSRACHVLVKHFYARRGPDPRPSTTRSRAFTRGRRWAATARRTSSCGSSAPGDVLERDFQSSRGFLVRYLVHSPIPRSPFRRIRRSPTAANPVGVKQRGRIGRQRVTQADCSRMSPRWQNCLKQNRKRVSLVE